MSMNSALGGASETTFVVVGANPTCSSMTLRDRLFVDESGLPGLLGELKACEFGPLFLVSTCDRIEAVTFARLEDAKAGVTRTFARRADVAAQDMAAELAVYSGADAVRHVFGVAASLLSTVIGDPQILGQFKDAHRIATLAATTSGALDDLVRAALVCAKRVRTETGVGESPASLASAATEAARDLHGDLSVRRGLLVGVAEQGRSIADAFLKCGLGHLAVTHGQVRRAEAMARDLGCHVVPFAIDEALAAADVVITALGERHWRLTPAQIERAVRERRRKPILILDLGLPGDTDPAIDGIEGAFRFTLGDLERIASGTHEHRRSEAAKAWKVVEAEQAHFFASLRARAAVPGVMLLRTHVEAMRAAVMAQAGGDAERATLMLVNRLLHAPSALLRSLAEAPPAPGSETEQANPRFAEELVLRAFGIEGGETAADTISEVTEADDSRRTAG